MRITDLMDSYYDDSVTLAEGEIPTADDVLALTRKKLGLNRKHHISVKVFLIAAVITVFGITAGAVGYSLQQAARTDLGIVNAENIPEYVEYQLDSTIDNPTGDTAADDLSLAEMPSVYVEEANIELISSLCSGNRVTAYLAISPVTQEMAQIADNELASGSSIVWGLGEVAEAAGNVTFDGFSSSGRQVEYDIETQTALVRYELEGDIFSQTDAFTVGIVWSYDCADSPEYKYFGPVTIPITPGNEVSFPIDAEIANDFLLSETASLTEITVSANYITCYVEYPPFEDFCTTYGGEAWNIIGQAYWGYYHKNNGTASGISTYNELDARVAYDRSWNSSLNHALEGAVLTLSDNSEILLDDLQPMSNSSETTYSFELPTPVSLEQVQSITFRGVTYSVNQGE